MCIWDVISRVSVILTDVVLSSSTQTGDTTHNDNFQSQYPSS